MRLAALTYQQYMHLQDTLRPFITPCLKYCDLQLADLEYSIRDGVRLPVVLSEGRSVVGLMVLELTDDAVHITTLAGDLPGGWHRTILDNMIEIAKGQGKTVLTCGGRKGWIRALKRFDAKMIKDNVTIEVN